MPGPEEDLYQTLGIPRDATPEEIAAAGRKAAKKAHPDMAGGSEEAFHKVSRAMTVLKDPEKKAHYDRTGSTETPNEGGEQAAALEILAMALNQQLSDPNVSPEFTDVVAGMKAGIRHVIAQQKAQIPPQRAAKARLEKFRRRLKMKGQDHAGHLENVMAGQDRLYAQNIASMEQNISRHEAALAMVEEYVYQVDERPPSPASTDPAWRTIGSILSEQGIAGGTGGDRGSWFDT